MGAIAVRRLAFTALAAGTLFLGTGLAAAGGEIAPRRHTITMEGNAFRPSELAVEVGDIVVWVNKDYYPHTATATTTAKEKRFDSGAIPAAASWSYTARDRGTFDYTCTYHPVMKGSLRVD